MKCQNCGLDGLLQKIHEGTGQPYPFDPRSGAPHSCKPRKMESDKYWCFACGDGGAAIPKINPCIHRRPDEVRALNEKQRIKNDPQKRIFESDDD